MRIKFSGMPAMVLAILLGVVVSLGLAAKDKDKGPKLANLQGKVQMTNKDNSTITVEQKDGVRRQVLYSGDSKFLMGHTKKSKPGAADQVKEGNFINCSGTYNDKMQLMAKECVYRDAK